MEVNSRAGAGKLSRLLDQIKVDAARPKAVSKLAEPVGFPKEIIFPGANKTRRDEAPKQSCGKQPFRDPTWHTLPATLKRKRCQSEAKAFVKCKENVRKALFYWCGRPDLNRHGKLLPRDFKSKLG
jgi:hypothetical protein